MKPSLAARIKSKVIVDTLDYLDTQDPSKRMSALDNLAIYAKHYGVALRKRQITPNIKRDLKSFILNNEGYIATIPPLYNSLINS